MSGEARRMPPLAAGRRPAGLALLRWLEDLRAPRLCLVTGRSGSGRSHLLEWLALGCQGDGVPEAQRVHAVLPGGGWSVKGAVWSLGSRLALLARTPEELVSAVAEDEWRTVICVPRLAEAADPARLVSELLDPLLRLEHVRVVTEAVPGVGFPAVAGPAVLDLDQSQWTDQARFTAWCGRVGGNPAGYPSPGAALGRTARPATEAIGDVVGRIPWNPDGSPDLVGAGEELLGRLWQAGAREGALGDMLGDAEVLAFASPAVVTAVLDGRQEPVAAAWEAAGPALAAEPDPLVRAAVLHARLLGMDEKAAARLADFPAPWRAAWAMWPNSSLGWPGPVASLAVGAGSTEGQLMLGDPSGVIRTVDAATGTPRGRVPLAEAKPLRGVTVTAGGDVVLLDSLGTLAAADGTGWLDEPLAALQSASVASLSAVAAVADLAGAAPAAGDEAGAVHWYRDGAVHSRQLHAGPVTALAGALHGGTPVLVSGGFDGAVRLWTAGMEPSAEAWDVREREVSAVAVAGGPAGMTTAAAWADGLVRVRRPDGSAPLELRLGSQIWALALKGDLLVLGTSDGVAAVRI